MGARSALISGVAASADPNAVASAPGPGGDVRVPANNASQGAYQSADQLSSDSNIDAVLGRCGHDRRMQDELTLAIDPRYTSPGTGGSRHVRTVVLAQNTLRGDW